MIHYSCDRCRKTIDPNEELRYVVRLETYVAIEPTECDELADDRDYLSEIQDALEGDDDDGRLMPPESQRRTFDLCPECYRKFVQNPLGCDAHAHFGFSSN